MRVITQGESLPQPAATMNPSQRDKKGRNLSCCRRQSVTVVIADIERISTTGSDLFLLQGNRLKPLGAGRRRGWSRFFIGDCLEFSVGITGLSVGCWV